MGSVDRWLLPDGVDEVLPPQAHTVELLRRHLLDSLYLHGYDFVIPPALEYVDSLLSSPGKDLDLQTFKMVDQLTGRMMGLSADTTTQVARMDSHSYAQNGVNRLCYCRTVFHTQASSLLANRTPTQLGAELYGEKGVNSDVEIISLMLTTLDLAGCDQIHLNIGHVGIIQGVIKKAKLPEYTKNELIDLLSLQCISEIDAWVDRELPSELQVVFKQLIRLRGNEGIIQTTKELLEPIFPELMPLLNHIQQVVNAISSRFSIPIYCDLTEVNGYQYHNGLIFSAYVPGYGDAIAQGGRYDGIGEVFGRSRAATGFSTDLRVLTQLGHFQTIEVTSILAPSDDDVKLLNLIEKLRKEGRRVKVVLSGSIDKGVTHIANQGNEWVVVER
jgi:ATP phosphoribosyltransferase regulatory subunit